MSEELTYDIAWLSDYISRMHRRPTMEYAEPSSHYSSCWTAHWGSPTEARRGKFPLSYNYYRTIKRSYIVPYHVTHVCYNAWGTIEGFVSQLTNNGDAVIVSPIDAQWERLYEYFTHCPECLNTKRHYD